MELQLLRKNLANSSTNTWLETLCPADGQTDRLTTTNERAMKKLCNTKISYGISCKNEAFPAVVPTTTKRFKREKYWTHSVLLLIANIVNTSYFEERSSKNFPKT